MIFSMTDKPHDRYVKRLLQRPEIAADILRFVLPEALAAALDLATIEDAGTEFVDDRLQQTEPDIVLKMKTVNGVQALLFVVLEHQSSVDPWMACRMSRNTMRLWESWRAKNTKAMRLPVVIPVVLYHGDAPWQAETNIGELIDGADVRDAIRNRGGFAGSTGFDFHLQAASKALTLMRSLVRVLIVKGADKPPGVAKARSLCMMTKF